MQSFLGDYPHSATNKIYKFEKAIDSVLQQSYKDVELIIIADGCNLTTEIIKDKYKNKLNCFYIEKQKAWSGIARNIGIEASTGEFILYLDTDDYLGENHITNISKSITDKDVYFFDDYVYKNNLFVLRSYGLSLGKCGTSNICHKKSIEARWNEKNVYGADDWNFIKKLKQYNFKKIYGAEYYVCHIPKIYDI